MEDLPLGRIAALVPEFAVKDLPLGRTLKVMIGTSECAGECRFSGNLCKRALDITAGVIVEATRNEDILSLNSNAL